jgi:hypothetical protein
MFSIKMSHEPRTRPTYTSTSKSWIVLVARREM